MKFEDNSEKKANFLEGKVISSNSNLFRVKVETLEFSFSKYTSKKFMPPKEDQRVLCYFKDISNRNSSPEEVYDLNGNLIYKMETK